MRQRDGRRNGKATIAFTGGGSGGHVFPGLAVSEALAKRGSWRCVWIGSPAGMERAVVRRWGMAYYSSPAGKLRRYFSIRNGIDILWCVVGVIRSLLLLARLRPKLLFANGGYVSVPPVVAAYLLGVPVITHESDVTPGLATRINARCAAAILVSYPQTRMLFPPRLRSKVHVTGNPVRNSIAKGTRQTGLRVLGLDGNRPMLLFLGGSLGAMQINELVEALVPSLTALYDVVHQSGQRLPAVARSSDITGTKPGHYVRRAFFGDDFADVLAASSLVICRAGASTLWELAAQRKPALLLPLQGAGTRGDQISNATLFCRIGGASMLDSKDLTPQELLLAIDALMSGTRRAAMAAAAATLPAHSAADSVADLICARMAM